MTFASQASSQRKNTWVVWSARRETNDNPDDREIIKGRKKRKVALWVGFNGQAYCGSQVNR